MTTEGSPLYEIDREGCYVFVRRATRKEILDLASHILETCMRRSETLQNPNEAKLYLSLQLGDLEREVFCCLFLDNRHRVIAFDKLFLGTIDGTSVHAREVVKAALKCNAAAVIFAHNHPSGVAEPSRADEALTRQLKDALALVGIRVLDHIIVAGTDTVSLAERGLL
jgi:DNA repair protein RadC